jgi:hypothetical protein
VGGRAQGAAHTCALPVGALCSAVTWRSAPPAGRRRRE